MAEHTAQRLLVFLPPHRAVSGSHARTTLSSSTLVHYVAQNPGGELAGGQTPVALLPKAHAVDLVFDTADVFVTEVQTPKMSDAKLRQALPNLLEDRLLAEAQDSHIAFAPASSRTSGGGASASALPPRVPVAVIDRGLLTRALDVMADVGYRSRAAYSAIYTVPAPAPGQLCVRVHGGLDVARSGRHEGFTFDFDGKSAPAALQLAVQQLGIKKILAYGTEAGSLARFATALGAVVEVVGRELDLASSDEAVNLLQGAFAQGGALGNFSLPRLTRGAMKLPLIYAACAAGVYVLGMNLYWLKLKHEDATLRSGMETAFRSAFPEVTTVVDPVLQTRRNMSALRARVGMASSDDFSVLNAQAVQLMSLAPVGAIAGLEYRDGSLRLKFKPGMSSDAGLQNLLRSQAVQQGLDLKFEPDGSARLRPAGG